MTEWTFYQHCEGHGVATPRSGGCTSSRDQALFRGDEPFASTVKVMALPLHVGKDIANSTGRALFRGDHALDLINVMTMRRSLARIDEATSWSCTDRTGPLRQWEEEEAYDMPGRGRDVECRDRAGCLKKEEAAMIRLDGILFRRTLRRKIWWVMLFVLWIL